MSELPQAPNPSLEPIPSSDPQFPDTSLQSDRLPQPETPLPSDVKLAMRNMVKKGGKSLYHFALTTMGLLALLVGLAYLTR